MWVYWNIEEGEYPPPPAPADRLGVVRTGFLRSFFGEVRQYCRDCFAQPYYLSVFFMLTVAGLSFVPVNTFSIPYALSLGVTMDTYGNAVALTFLISLSVSFFLGWLADIFHPIRMTAIILAGYVLVAAWGGFYATTPNTFLAILVLHGVLSGCYFTTVASLGQRLYPHSKFAQFTSAFGIFWALANIVLVPLVGMLIDRAGNVYRHTFAMGCLFALAALGATWLSYRKFMRLGGPKNYVAP
jgi:MFS family permease